MTKTKKIYSRTITFERIVATAYASDLTERYCEECHGKAEMFRIESACAEFGVSMRDLFRLSETESIHAVETANGQILICRESLNAFTKGVMK